MTGERDVQERRQRAALAAEGTEELTFDRPEPVRAGSVCCERVRVTDASADASA